MKHTLLPMSGAILSLLLLTACGQDAPVQSSVVAGASDVASSAPQSAQVLTPITTQDGALKLHMPVPEANGAKLQIEGIDAENIVLTHREEAEDFNVYAVKSGEPKQTAEAYFTQLKQDIEAAKLNDTQVYPAQDNRLIYRFSRQENGETLNEACMAVYSPAQIHTVCTTSPSLTLGELEATLRQLDPKPAS